MRIILKKINPKIKEKIKFHTLNFSTISTNKDKINIENTYRNSKIEKIRNEPETKIISKNPNQETEGVNNINKTSILNNKKETLYLYEQFDQNNTLFNHIIGIIMKNGKKTKAQKQLQNTFIYIKQKTNADPYFIFSKAIEKTSPLVKLISSKKGTKSIKIPIPLNQYQRHRKAIIWILEASDKRNSKSFSERLAEELIAITDGTSPVLQKKEQLYKLALVNTPDTNLTIKLTSN
ncbi:hypothetical protein PORY_001723 [Pneumocystis oryctolagi]|uniref:Uncharacterized protein n=1 Tax=Pneumocystis oryctolagi TaxID=42067 RepID=A0ACB7CDM8_9ASCO|nr:hypothetical protein PORY_001723 [Pneumocystis oryctolagi]